MHCQFSALADAANMSAEGKLNVLGEFDVIWGLEEPVKYLSMVFVAKLKGSEGDLGVSRIQLRVVDEDEQLVALLVDGELNFKQNVNPGGETGIPVIVPVHGAMFPRFGAYEFQLLIDGKVMGHPPKLYVRELLSPDPA